LSVIFSRWAMTPDGADQEISHAIYADALRE
jgi:hypothetical protein